MNVRNFIWKQQKENVVAKFMVRTIIVCALATVSCGERSTEIVGSNKVVPIEIDDYLNVDTAGVGTLVFYDKARLPKAIKDYYSEKWNGFNIANPSEDWNCCCMRSVALPNRRLESITTDTVTRKFLVMYVSGGFATMHKCDHFRLSKDGKIANVVAVN
jgi:hypothetical protein